MTRKPREIRIDVGGTIASTARGLAEDVIGLIVVVAIFGCLFAPLFANTIEKRMMYKPDGRVIRASEFPQVYRTMKSVKLILWLVCITAWTATITLAIWYHQS